MKLCVGTGHLTPFGLEVGAGKTWHFPPLINKLGVFSNPKVMHDLEL